ncbi:hypothetical protein N9V84_09290, partial [Verrucomicrobiales bacterium]|nr:hypothetical protein [Verrucomicrobiales bacterium]
MTVPDILTLVANPEALETLDAESLKHHFVVLNGHYAGSQDPALVPILLELYGRWAEQSEPSQRLPVLADTIGLAEEEWGAPFLALMPFIAAETDHQVISSAALGLASVAPGECDSDKGTYAGASWVADLLMAKQRLDETDGSVLAGLLLLGDRRVLELAKAIWQRLPSEGRLRAAQARSGFAYRPHLEFLLWALEDETDASVFGALAAAVLNLANLHDAVVEIDRHLPVWDAPDPDEPIQLLSRHTLRETGEALRSQLEALIVDEPGEEKVLPKAFAPLLGIDEDEAGAIPSKDSSLLKATPEERARRFAEGKHQADWKGERFTDTEAFWHREKALCQLALMMQMQDIRSAQNAEGSSDSDSDIDPDAEDSGQTFPKAFPFYRESAELGLPGDHRQYWLGLATLAGYHFARSTAFDRSHPAIQEELSGAATYTTSLISFIEDRKPSVGMLGLFYQALHQTLGLDITLCDDPALLFGVADRALWLGAGVAMANEERSSAWMKQASRSVTLAESILVTSLLDADAAETTGQLMIPSLLKLCLRRYDEGTAEAEAIGSYFEQTLAEGGLDQDEPPERWFADAFAFARALVKEHPETGRAILVSV